MKHYIFIVLFVLTGSCKKDVSGNVQFTVLESDNSHGISQPDGGFLYRERPANIDKLPWFFKDMDFEHFDLLRVSTVSDREANRVKIQTSLMLEDNILKCNSDFNYIDPTSEEISFHVDKKWIRIGKLPAGCRVVFSHN